MHNERCGLRIAYLSLQAVEQGQDSWAAVMEIIRGMTEAGVTVDPWFVEYPGGAPGAAGRFLAMRRLQRELIRRLRDYDAVYVRAHPFAGPLSAAALRAGVPVVQECNGSYEDLFIAWPAARPLRRLLEGTQRRQYAEASAVIAVTPQLADWVRAETGRADVVVSGNGANAEVFRPDVSPLSGLPERYVAFFGQFAEWQGIRVLLDAANAPGWPCDVSLVFAGDGAMKADVERAATEDGGRVLYLGRLPYEDVPGLVAGSLAAAVPMFAPERAETGLSPLKLFESMACGVPVVAADTPGIAEVVLDAECGVLFEPGGADALARAVRALAEDRAEAAAMGARGRRAVLDRYSWPARARQRMAVIEGVLLSRSSSSWKTAHKSMQV